MKIYKFNDNKNIDPFNEEDWDEEDGYDNILIGNGYKKYRINSIVSNADESYQKKLGGFYVDVFIWKEKTLGNGNIVPIQFEFQLYYVVGYKEDVTKTIIYKQDIGGDTIKNVETFLIETVERMKNFYWK